MGGPRLWGGCLATCAVLFGASVSCVEAAAEVAEVRDLHLEAPGPLHPATRDDLFTKAARQAVTAAWQARHPDRAPPFLSERLVGKAVRHIDVIDETIAPDRYAVTLNVGVAMGVLRLAAGLPEDAAPEMARAIPQEPVPQETAAVRILVPVGGAGAALRHREQPVGSGGRWIHVGADAVNNTQTARLRIGSFVGSGQPHPGFHCLSVKVCSPE
ncbi:hypothetical protein [Azospirillum soli]|uniref:hypothetical protein n=1 Tax=Azospirillum soli TaxID=1304799 RepID=UPI001AE8449B|nr:hypothetical protein [Azospirillum soli]MBP2316718.1 hypothetical protein [Azospirillum soli]